MGQLETALGAPDTKRRYVRRLFGTIADRYDFITRFLSFGRDAGWKVRLVELAAIQPGARVLDLACGTGDIAFEAARRGAGCVVGLDITPRMLELAREKPESRGPLSWVVGDINAGMLNVGRNRMLDRGNVRGLHYAQLDAEALPFPDRAFDCVTMAFGLRNVTHKERALAEIHRVLRPGGLMCSLDFNRPESAFIRAVYLTYLTIVGSTLGWVLHRDPDTYRYIPVLGGFMAIHIGRKGS